ncbi:MAG: RNA 2'-phosphotransferase [Planctomycetaceae bacterium]|nr:RNA 2'-phosphotransferase [Planctomycetaceae bacterium]
MAKHQKTQTSRFLSYILRHRPDEIGVTLDNAGWVDIETLLDARAAHGRPIERSQHPRHPSSTDGGRGVCVFPFDEWRLAC